MNWIKKLKYTKSGTLRFYRIMQIFRKKTPKYHYKSGYHIDANGYRSTVRFGSFDHIFSYNLCKLGFHQPYANYVYPSCWVCGAKCYLKEHINNYGKK